MSAPSRDGMGSSPPSSTRRQFSEDKFSMPSSVKILFPTANAISLGVMYAIFVPFGILIGYSLQLKIGTLVFSSIRHSMDDTSRLPSTTQGDSTADSSSLTLLVTIVETPTRKVKVSVFHDVSARYFAKKSFPSSIGTSPGKSAAMML
ncbi:WD repeat and HMG-box DNA-binding protein 1 [Frankliniella fusca]|uniref:WD repeat and HMG-box DNA-binding protein 1 n=2 Tax=Frankliniella fusca TaxID=407009 RepID=A0AAE1L8Q0_9NEOP|nr:WD repeat and HMG-box DNA-binding protein 1 [Frankliniella fusca]